MEILIFRINIDEVKQFCFLKIYLRILIQQFKLFKFVLIVIPFSLDTLYNHRASRFNRCFRKRDAQLRLPRAEDCATYTIYHVIRYTRSRGIKYWNYSDDRAHCTHNRLYHHQRNVSSGQTVSQIL